MLTQPIERIMARTVQTEHGCWIWQGATTAGYGQVRHMGRMQAVHRVVYAELVGPFDGELDHLCRMKACCNPAHLEPVTGSENTRRGDAGAAQLVCTKGHWLLADNVVWRVDGNGRPHRRCRACIRRANNEWARANRDKINRRKRALRASKSSSAPC